MSELTALWSRGNRRLVGCWLVVGSLEERRGREGRRCEREQGTKYQEQKTATKRIEEEVKKHKNTCEYIYFRVELIFV